MSECRTTHNITCTCLAATTKILISLCVKIFLSGASDYSGGPYQIRFTEGDPIPHSICAMISTTNDDLLEGDHNFTVAIDTITPTEVVTVIASSFSVTITDDADGEVYT